MDFDRFESAGYLINHLSRLFFQGLAERIAPLGLAPGQFMLLLILWEKDGVTQRELVDLLDVEQATVSNTLARMERDGLIVRRPHPSDGRAQAIYLTKRARGLDKPATDAASEVNVSGLAPLSPAERAAFLDMMRRVIATMHQPAG